MFSNTRTIKLLLLPSYTRYVLQYSMGTVDQRPRVCTISRKIKPLITQTPVLILYILRTSRPLIICLRKGFVYQNARSGGLNIESKNGYICPYSLRYRTVVCMFLQSISARRETQTRTYICRVISGHPSTRKTCGYPGTRSSIS